MPRHTTMSKVKFEGSFVRMCVSRWALREVLKEPVVVAAQMDGDSELWRQSTARRAPSYMVESQDWGQTGGQSQRSGGGGWGTVEFFVCRQPDIKVTPGLKWR